MAPGVIFSILYTSSPTLPHIRLPTPLARLASRLLIPLIHDSAPPRRADRVLPGEISESASQALARMRELERAVRGAEERDAAVRRRVGEEVAGRRRRLVGVLQGLEAVQARAAEAEAEAERTQQPQNAAPRARDPFVDARSSRFGLGGWVDRAGEAVGIRSTSGGEAPAGPEGSVVEGAGTSGGSTPRGAPSQAEIDSVVGMFPNLSRDAVVRALQRRYVARVSLSFLARMLMRGLWHSNYNTALAVELLLQDST